MLAGHLDVLLHEPSGSLDWMLVTQGSVDDGVHPAFRTCVQRFLVVGMRQQGQNRITYQVDRGLECGDQQQVAQR